MSIDGSVSASPVSRTQQWWILCAVGFSMLLGTLDTSIVNVALPTLVQDLETDFATVQWAVLSYLLVITALLIAMGRLGDLVGKKLIFQIGQAVFLIGSVLCGLADSAYALIAFRALQAVGAAILTGLGLAIITETWPESQRGQAIGISHAVSMLGVVAGPMLGGLILEYFSWRWIFYINVPITAAGLILCARYMPAMRQETAGGKFDLPGALLVGVGLTAFCLLLTLTQDAAAIPPWLWPVLIAVTLVALALFVVRERTCAHPMVDFAIFRLPGFGHGLMLQSFIYITLTAVVLMLPFYLVQARGFPLLWVGLLQASVPIALIVVAPLAGYLSDRMGSLPLIGAGMVGICLGYLVSSNLSLDTSPGLFVLYLLPLGVGVSMVLAPSSRNIMSAAPEDQLGVANGILNMVRTLTNVIGIPLLSAFMVWRLRIHQGAPTDLAAASPPIFVQGFRDLLLFCAAVTFCGLMYLVWSRNAHRSETERETV